MELYQFKEVFGMLCFNFETGQYENITEDGFSFDQGMFVTNWDRSGYDFLRQEEERQRQEELDELLKWDED